MPDVVLGPDGGQTAVLRLAACLASQRWAATPLLS